MLPNAYLYIFTMAAVTFLIRALPLTLIRKPIRSRLIRSFLHYVPYVTLAVMTFPAILSATGSWLSGLLALLWRQYPEAVASRYKIEAEPDAQGYALLEAVGRKRGFLISGGEVDTERAARMVLEEYRSGKLGRFTLDLPPQEEKV